ncbi:MAG: RNA polymerase factor sigma-54 [Kangiellaceae bacterium]|nr:RNA polymerase factor sigma-54 [Kangiellaceae bacterium]
MKQTLQLRIGQSLTMTPQLQQAIKLLQLSSIDLEAEIQEIIESNPLLDIDSAQNNEAQDSIQQAGDSESKSEINNHENSDAENHMSIEDRNTTETLATDKIESELASDTQWEDWGYVSQSTSPKLDDSNGYDYQGETSDSLRDQLIWHVNMASLSETDKTIATILIDSVDDSGFMKADLEDVANMLNIDQQPDAANEKPNGKLSDDESLIQVDEVEAVLHFIQSFEPAGIAARSLQECLQIQLTRKIPESEVRTLSQNVINSQFDLLAARNYRQIMRNLKISDVQLKAAIDVIQSLNPRPGNQLTQNNAQYIKPDVYVSKNSANQWIVQLNPESTPKLKINEQYAKLIKRADNSSDNQFLKNNFQDAKWFIKSLQSRNDTLLKVSRSIVEKQTGFLEYGEEAMKPLVLQYIAEEVEMHESTISRVTTQKFMHTPKGIFELKYFFSSHVGTDSGGECSSTAIRAVIKKLVAAENQTKPLSDSKISILLKDQGIKVARRTVAKYRESMAIPPSNERKALL